MSFITYTPVERYTSKSGVKYHIPLSYNYGSNATFKFDDFLFDAGQLIAHVGHIIDDHITCTFTYLSPVFISTLYNIHHACATVLKLFKRRVGLPNFTIASATTTGFPYPTDNGTLTLKLSIKSLSFTDSLNNPIPVTLLQNHQLKLIPLFHFQRIKVKNYLASLQIR